MSPRSANPVALRVEPSPLVIAAPSRRAPRAAARPGVPTPPQLDLRPRPAAPGRPGPAALDLDDTVAASDRADAPSSTAKPRDPLDALGDRYKIRQRLDAGGQGVIYEAWDTKEQRRIAVKVCSGLAVSDHHRLKREYRAIKQLSHPNIARVFDLIEDRERGLACFTMELIQGVDFITHIRRAAPAGQCRADLTRLRRTTRQLVEGLSALHAAGHTHRDIKPSNVLVAEDGRVVILDFGLVTAVRRDDQATLCTREIIGTPHYMAPEQIVQDTPPGPAIDCYAIGVILYEALTGRMPLDSEFLTELLAAKRFQRPRPPSAVVAGIPAELDALVIGLLEREPGDRATIADITAWCGDSTEPRPAAPDGSKPAGPSPATLVGRRDPLQRLARALSRLRRREAHMVVVKGPAGAGKSALLRHFLTTVRAHVPQALILEGRCDAHESVPFRAFDRIIDDLARFLIACPKGQRDELLGGDLVDLARVFPILTRVPGVAREASAEPAKQGARERAFAELRGLLGRVGRERALILSIANLHRSDRDSLQLLEVLTAPDSAIPMLVVTTIRGDADAPLMIDLEVATPPEIIDVALLTAEETIPYAREQLAAAGSTDLRLARALAFACRGDTRLLARLAPHVARRPPTLAGDEVTLELAELLAPRLAELPALGRRLLELVVLADGPLAFSILDQASGARGRSRPALLRLRELGLVDVDERDEGPEGGVVRCVSEAVIAAIAAAIPSDRRAALHRALAQAHQDAADGDEERCAHHWIAADELRLARDHAANAALIAASALAFEHATRLYALAVRCDPKSRELRLKLADTLAACGEFERAAVERLRAAIGTIGRRRVELATIACDHFFLAGRGDRGRRSADAILRELAIDLPADDDQVERILRSELACLRGHNLDFREQPRSQIGGDLLLRIDAPLMIGRHLRDADPTRAAILLARAAHFALLAGEPGRVIQALALAATVIVGRDRALAHALLARAERVAARSRVDHGAGVVALCRGLVRLHEGEAMAALVDLATAQEILGARGLIGPWERRTLILGTLAAHDALGEVASLEATLRAHATDPAVMKDDNLLRWMAVYEGILFVAHGEIERAELRVCTALRSLEGHDPRLVLALTARLAVLCDLHRGVPRKARSRVTPPGLAIRSPHGGDDPRVACHHWGLLDGRVALACAALRTRDHERCCEAVARVIEALAPHCSAPAIAGEVALLRAGLAHLRGDRTQAIARLHDADRHFLSAGMLTSQVVAQLRLGDLTGGAAGQVLRARARQRLRSEGICEPDSWAAAVAPGFDDPARLPGLRPAA